MAREPEPIERGPSPGGDHPRPTPTIPPIPRGRARAVREPQPVRKGEDPPPLT